MTIKAISLWQPWATAWAIGLKKAETRHWAPAGLGDLVQKYGAPLAVHAAKTERDPVTGQSLREWFEERLYGGVDLREASEGCATSRAAFAAAGIKSWAALPRGSIIAVCRLSRVRWSDTCEPDALESSWGNYSPGRHIWIAERMTLLPEPIPCVGRQGLFNWEVPAALHQLPAVADVIGPF